MSRMLLTALLSLAVVGVVVAHPRAAVAQVPMPRIVAVDTFRDPAIGILPRAGADPTRVQVGYDGGAYLIRTLDPEFSRESVAVAFLPGEYDDASFAVSARLVGTTADRSVALHCRRPATETSGYRFEVAPANGRWRLLRFDSGSETQLAVGDDDAINRGTEWNRIALSCIGTRISASVNGVLVVTRTDDRHRRGRAWIGADRLAGASGTVEARFDNLLVTQEIGGDWPIPMADDFDDGARAFFPTTTVAPDAVRFAYAGGEYQVQSFQGGVGATSAPPGAYFDPDMAVDARLVGDVRGRYVECGCRGTDDGGYRLRVHPEDGTFSLARLTAGGAEYFEGRQRISSSVVRRGNATNRLGLTCVFDLVIAYINDEEVADLEVDDAFDGGDAWLGAGSLGGSGPVDARFDNFVIATLDF